MSLVSSPAVRFLRRIGRRLGINALLGRALGGDNYEDRFGEAVCALIRPGDCVWDVGANVGFYAEKFARLTGEAGQIVAIEPSPKNLARLRTAVGDLTNVLIFPVALGSRPSTELLVQGQDQVGATSRLVSRETPVDGEVTDVRVVTGEMLRSECRARTPNVIKIDTEGFEFEVVTGLGSVLAEPDLRAVCVEVHFGLLEQRGLPDGPRRIEEALSSAGFRHRWTDASHLVAERGR